MSPGEVAVDFYESAFAAFARHFVVRAHGLSMDFLRVHNPVAWKTWSEHSSLWERPGSELDHSMDVLVSPDGKDVWAATVGKNRGVYIRLEMTGQRLTHFWWKSFIKASAGDEADALNPIVTKSDELTGAGWTRHLVEDGELIEE